VAAAVLGSSLPLRRVVVPSPAAYGRVLARSTGAGRSDALGPTELFRRALAGTPRALDGAAAPDPPGGVPIPPLVLDPGVTAGQLESACGAAGVEWQRVDEVSSAAFAASMRGDATLFLSAGFPMILPRRLLEIPSLGAVGFHASLLPRCRGCHPIFWTLASGETQGGVTAHFMTPEIDGGNIVAQIPIPLTEEDDYQSLYRRAMEGSRPLVAMVEAFFAAGGGPGAPQDPVRATCFHEDTESDHHINWAGRSPREIVALARTGEAFTIARGERLGVLRAVEVHNVARERRRAAAGSVLAVNDDALVVEASGGAVALRSLAWRGRRHGGGDLARALGLRRGEVLG
jgi:methionyl-tRNA formyltransferase